MDDLTESYPQEISAEKFTWTDERILLLGQLILAGEMSSTDIGQVLGCSRNAAIGKANRLGFKGPRSQPDNVGRMPRRLQTPEMIAEAKRRRNEGRAERRKRARERDAAAGIKRPRKSPRYGHDAGVSLPPVPQPDIDPLDLAIPVEQRKQIADLGWCECRFPIGEPGVDLFFCGALTDDEGRSYCARHWERAHQKRNA